MNYFRKILFPFAILYAVITHIRNFLYDKKILKSHSFDLPVIVVGNLSVGGTGKTPQVEYLINLLADTFQLATLSRGYKRKSQGFVLANSTSDASNIGDEPFQYYQKFKNIQVAVDANRKKGIEQLLLLEKRPDVILLDDAYQHRQVSAGFSILLTAYNDLFSDDWLLPTGNLRESRSGKRRANIVVVTKCPKDISVEKQKKIEAQLKLNENQALFFTYVEYDDFVYSENEKISVTEIRNREKLLLAGIAKPKPFFEHLEDERTAVLTFPDHHAFSKKDILEIKNISLDKIIITTEKDYVRLKESISSEQLFYLPIKNKFVNNGNLFDKIILNYVGKSSRNSKLHPRNLSL